MTYGGSFSYLLQGFFKNLFIVIEINFSLIGLQIKCSHCTKHKRYSQCTNCEQARCIYSKQQLSDHQLRELHRIMRSYEYYCGCMIIPNASSLSGEAFTRLELICNFPIKWAYYGASIRTMRKILCSYCGVKDGAINQELRNARKLCYQYARSARSLRCQWNGCLIRQQRPKEELRKCFQTKNKKKTTTLTPACY